MNAKVYFWLMNLSFLCSLVAGCKNLSIDVKDKTALVDSNLKNAQVEISQADDKVVSVTTQPGISVTSQKTLISAHTDLKTADKNVATARGVLPTIQKDAQKLQDQRDSERNHWVGYKGRVALWSLAGGLVFLAIVGFLVSGGNFTLIFAVISSAWKLAQPILKVVGHILSLGIVYLVGKILKKVTIATPVAPAAPVVTEPSAPVAPAVPV